MTEELKQKTEKLAELQKKMFAFKYATSAMYLDGVTVAPRDTEEGRGEALGILSEYAYSLATSKETIDTLRLTAANFRNTRTEKSNFLCATMSLRKIFPQTNMWRIKRP